ncbi:hypothetical protein K7X08_032508 [Anisodus acutangulus]|uniref:Uncharacterized protein n=1 Tax=Anisodus acutangulus TaxID=402998 RepID=A0A9Q1R5D4_9SOLA|nr:hypothetical protein K7X08_032508 [Anisodus acutangulus]
MVKTQVSVLREVYAGVLDLFDALKAAEDEEEEDANFELLVGEDVNTSAHPSSTSPASSALAFDLPSRLLLCIWIPCLRSLEAYLAIPDGNIEHLIL